MRKKILLVLLIGISGLVLTFFVLSISEAQRRPPSVNLWASPSTVSPGGSTTLYWDTMYADVCQASGGWSGWKNVPSGSQRISNITSDTTFTLTCWYLSVSASDSVTVTVTPPPPTVNFWADLYTVGYGESTTLRWSSANTTVCYRTMGTSVWRDGGGPQPVAGSGSTGALTSNTTFGINCYNAENVEAASTITIYVIGECSPGATKTRTCTYCVGTVYYTGGSQTRRCRSDFTWGRFSSCSGGTASCNAAQCGAECSDGGTQTCGKCGSQTCQSDCRWGPCTGEGVCYTGLDSPDCSCSADGCVGVDYYNYPDYGDCTASCACDIGTDSGQPCEPTIRYSALRCPVSLKSPLEAKSFVEFIDNLINFIFKITIVLAPLLIIIAGFLFITARDNLEQIARAKRIIFWTVAGFLIVLLSKGILVIVKQLLGV
ncbi:MAG: pilin [Candidatus Paceibacterales bacterium]